MFFSGLVKPQPTSSGSKHTLIPNLIGQTPPPPSPGGRSFAAALRNLAKQAGPPSTHSNGKIINIKIKKYRFFYVYNFFS